MTTGHFWDQWPLALYSPLPQCKTASSANVCRIGPDPLWWCHLWLLTCVNQFRNKTFACSMQFGQNSICLSTADLISRTFERIKKNYCSAWRTTAWLHMYQIWVKLGKSALSGTHLMYRCLPRTSQGGVLRFLEVIDLNGRLRGTAPFWNFLTGRNGILRHSPFQWYHFHTYVKLAHELEK